MILQSTPGLLVMAFFAECLPILLIPEQQKVTPVRNDVINHRRRGDLPIFQAALAQGISMQKQLACFTPPGIIAPCSCVAPQRIMRPFLAMCLTIGARFAQIRTAGIAAGASRFHWHMDCLAL